jgi:hypothetical protein
VLISVRDQQAHAEGLEFATIRIERGSFLPSKKLKTLSETASSHRTAVLVSSASQHLQYNPLTKRKTYMLPVDAPVYNLTHALITARSIEASAIREHILRHELQTVMLLFSPDTVIKESMG